MHNPTDVLPQIINEAEVYSIALSACRKHIFCTGPQACATVRQMLKCFDQNSMGPQITGYKILYISEQYFQVNFQAPSQNFETRLLASSCSSVRLSVRMEQLGSHWTDFHEI
jgi:hypothetical protein